MTQDAENIAQDMFRSIRSGNTLALARAISEIECGAKNAEELLDLVYADVGQAERIGITGPPGTGKSTLVAGLGAYLRSIKNTEPLAIVAVDPSSPYTGGALLGDRFRMTEIANDEGVFIRSMASRGTLGGLSEASEAACDVLEAGGYQRIIVETVGVGQNEVDIASACDTCVLVLNPESGDSVQALKAGLMEIADIIVVNKADNPRVERFVNDVRSALDIRSSGENPPPVLTTTATESKGIDEVWRAIENHRQRLATEGQLKGLREVRARRRLKELWLALLRNSAFKQQKLEETFERLVTEIAGRQTSPYRAARELLEATIDHSEAERFSSEDLSSAIAADRQPAGSEFTPPSQDDRDTDTRTHLRQLGP